MNLNHVILLKLCQLEFYLYNGNCEIMFNRKTTVCVELFFNYRKIVTKQKTNLHYRNNDIFDFSVPNLDLLNNEVVKNIAKKNGITEAQVLLRFLIQQNIAVIPKSINPDRMRENFQVYISYYYVCFLFFR